MPPSGGDGKDDKDKKVGYVSDFPGFDTGKPLAATIRIADVYRTAEGEAQVRAATAAYNPYWS